MEPLTFPAKTLSDAYNALDPRQPVTPADVPTLFVERPHTPVHKMRAQLQVSRKPLKLLFVGHRGSGKSSEMAYLSTLLESEYLTMPIPLYGIFTSPAVSHTELIFAMTLRLLQTATDEEVVPRGVVNQVWEDLLAESYHSLKRLLFGEQPDLGAGPGSVSVKLSVLAAELETKVGTESYTRNQIKEKFEGRIAELLTQIRDVGRLLETKIGKRLLFIVEDLDKFDPADTRKLFLDHSRTLTEPYPSIVYTFPVALRYHNDFREIKQGFDHYHLLPNFALRHRDGSSDRDGRQAMWEILLRRVEPTVFADNVLDHAISLSGGHVTTVIQLLQQATLQAVVDRAEKVNKDHLEIVRCNLRDEYAVMLKREQVKLLRQLHDDADKDLLDGSSTVKRENERV